jgi:hypothetical protein
MKSQEDIREYLRNELITAIEAKAAKCDDEAWTNGIPGAILEGRMNMLGEIIDFITEE